MTGQQITVLGECVADAFTRAGGDTDSDGTDSGDTYSDGLSLRVLPGGGPANTAVALARLGTRTRFIGRLSQDVFGGMFRARLAASGVDLGGCVTAAEPSTLAVADLDAHGRAAYSFHAEGSADWQWTAEELAAAPLEGAACLHTGSLALIREPGGPRVEEYLAEVRDRVTVSVDPNVRPLLVPPAAYRARLGRWCALADILRLSDDDLAALLPGAAPEEACDRWHEAGARLVVVTLGERGALASLDGTRVRVPAVSVDVVDTVGAGDAFTAGLLHALAGLGRLGGRLDGLTAGETEACCAYATRVAALTCAVPGANPPWADGL
ncbi:carbohydrate kinase [Streptomyces sp. TRM64462]|uniref:carbohydrate kinase family protein n=1 Tax=Streptomyces sp. TRM64462 TaxID=2741726 RepID=UPI001586C758|nr:carbohydrate kinase [Streptomyces sp. TRM64462]